MHIVKRTGDRCVRRHPAAIRPNVKCFKRRRGTPKKISNLWPDVALSISLPLSDERNKNFVEFFTKNIRRKRVLFRWASAGHRPLIEKELFHHAQFFHPPFDSFMHQLLFHFSPIVFICFPIFHNTLKRIVYERTCTAKMWRRPGKHLLYSNLSIDSSFQSLFWFDLTIQSKVVQGQIFK